MSLDSAVVVNPIGKGGFHVGQDRQPHTPAFPYKYDATKSLANHAKLNASNLEVLKLLHYNF